MIDLVKPEFIAGSEKRFYDFIGKLNDKDKIAIVSHGSDLDGLMSAKIINEVIKSDSLKLKEYEELNSNLLKELKKEKINKIIITDLNFTNPDFIKPAEKFAEILIIDHHTFSEDLNSEKTVFLNAQGYCAAYLSYFLLSKIENLEKYDWLIACASLSDWCYKKNAGWMSGIFEKYKDKFDLDDEKLRKTKIWKIQYQICLAISYFKKQNDILTMYNLINEKFSFVNEIQKYSNIIQKEIDLLTDEFKEKRYSFKDFYFMETSLFEGVQEFAINELSRLEPNKTFIMCRVRHDKYKISARRQDGKVNLPELLKKLLSGLKNSSSGGHIRAAGGYMQLKDREEFIKRVKNL